MPDNIDRTGPVSIATPFEGVTTSTLEPFVSEPLPRPPWARYTILWLKVSGIVGDASIQPFSTLFPMGNPDQSDDDVSPITWWEAKFPITENKRTIYKIGEAPRLMQIVDETHEQPMPARFRLHFPCTGEGASAVVRAAFHWMT